MIDFLPSIIDRSEPLGLRGKAIVRGRKRLMREAPILFPGQPKRYKSANSRDGVECCCGAPGCQNPCTSADCGYCTGASVLTALDLTRAEETWAPVSGAPIFPTCVNTLNACPGHPDDCAPINPANSYEESNPGQANTGIVVHDWHLISPASMTLCGTFAGSISLRQRESGVRQDQFGSPPCGIIQQPVDNTGVHSFEFRHKTNGWQLFSSTGGTDFNYHRNIPSPCASGTLNCVPGYCNARSVADDLICALLPLACDIGEVIVDSGCIQTQTEGVTKCEKMRVRINLLWNIES